MSNLLLGTIGVLMGKKAYIDVKGHKRDTRINITKPYTIPVIKKDNPDKWFISYSYRVPEPLQKYKDLYPRSTKRFKIYQGINSVTGEAREELAEKIRKTFEDLLVSGTFNPFSKQIAALEKAAGIKEERAIAKNLSEEDKRKLMLAKDVLQRFIESRKERKVEPKSLMAYQAAVNWMIAGFGDLQLSKVKYIDISKALHDASNRAKKPWTNHSINNQFTFANIALGWAVNEEYLVRNPLAGKIVKLKTDKTIHKWYDRETAKRVKEALKMVPWLLHVCQFTYWILIRSKKELQSIKVGDIDFDLQQVHFRKEWTKNDSDQNRDYGPEFAKVLEEMNLKNLPKTWYIFGEGGQPSPVKCGPNYFGDTWREIRNGLGLHSDYTIYGWKHTRIIHMMMLGVSSYDIAHAARHGNAKTSEDYKRDYDITLAKVYSKKDLTF